MSWPGSSKVTSYDRTAGYDSFPPENDILRSCDGGPSRNLVSCVLLIHPADVLDETRCYPYRFNEFCL
jgi:hypothetical protein